MKNRTKPPLIEPSQSLISIFNSNLVNSNYNYDEHDRLKFMGHNLWKFLGFFLIFNTILILSNCHVYAQPTDARVTFTASSPGFVSGIFYVVLPDSTGFSDVEISLKDNLEDSIVFSRVFVFDQTSGLPTGVTWLREGTRVYMGMGTLQNGISWKGKARLKETGGAWSDWYEFRFSN